MDERAAVQRTPAGAVPPGTDSRRGAQKAGGGTEADCAAKSAAAMTSEARGDRYHDCRIYVSNIPFSFRSPDLIAMFSPFGQVSNAEIVMNERGSKGFGFVTLDSKEASEAARAALNGTVVNGRVIEVKKATTMPHHRRSSGPYRPMQPAMIPQNLLLPPLRPELLTPRPLPQLPPFLAPNPADPLNALIFAQNQLRFQPVVNPVPTSDAQFHTLLCPRQFPGQQPATVMAGGLSVPSITVPSIPLQLLCAPPPRSAENLPSSSPLAAPVVPLPTAGIAYTPIPGVSSSLLLAPAVQPLPNQPSIANVTSDSNLLKPAQPIPTAGYLDFLGSLGLGPGVFPQTHSAGLHIVKECLQTSTLRALDQSCVIDTSLHGEPLKEGQFGPIGKAVPEAANVNQVASSSHGLHSTASVNEQAYGLAAQADGTNPSYIPVYQQFEPAIDRNGRKRLSSLEAYHLNKKQAKSS